MVAAVDTAQAEAAKQLQIKVPQKLEWLQGKLEDAEKRGADFKRAQQASAQAAQAQISDLEAQVLLHRLAPMCECSCLASLVAFQNSGTTMQKLYSFVTAVWVVAAPLCCRVVI